MDLDDNEFEEGGMQIKDEGTEEDTDDDGDQEEDYDEDED